MKNKVLLAKTRVRQGYGASYVQKKNRRRRGDKVEAKKCTKSNVDASCLVTAAGEVDVLMRSKSKYTDDVADKSNTIKKRGLVGEEFGVPKGKVLDKSIDWRKSSESPATAGSSSIQSVFSLAPSSPSAKRRKRSTVIPTTLRRLRRRDNATSSRLEVDEDIDEFEETPSDEIDDFDESGNISEFVPDGRRSKHNEVLLTRKKRSTKERSALSAHALRQVASIPARKNYGQIDNAVHTSGTAVQLFHNDSDDGSSYSDKTKKKEVCPIQLAADPVKEKEAKRKWHNNEAFENNLDKSVSEEVEKTQTQDEPPEKMFAQNNYIGPPSSKQQVSNASKEIIRESLSFTSDDEDKGRKLPLFSFAKANRPYLNKLCAEGPPAATKKNSAKKPEKPCAERNKEQQATQGLGEERTVVSHVCTNKIIEGSMFQGDILLKGHERSVLPQGNELSEESLAIAKAFRAIKSSCNEFLSEKAFNVFAYSDANSRRLYFLKEVAQLYQELANIRTSLRRNAPKTDVSDNSDDLFFAALEKASSSFGQESCSEMLTASLLPILLEQKLSVVDYSTQRELLICCLNFFVCVDSATDVYQFSERAALGSPSPLSYTVAKVLSNSDILDGILRFLSSSIENLPTTKDCSCALHSMAVTLCLGCLHAVGPEATVKPFLSPAEDVESWAQSSLWTNLCKVAATFHLLQSYPTVELTFAFIHKFRQSLLLCATETRGEDPERSWNCQLQRNAVSMVKDIDRHLHPNLKNRLPLLDGCVSPYLYDQLYPGNTRGVNHQMVPLNDWLRDGLLSLQREGQIRSIVLLPCNGIYAPSADGDIGTRIAVVPWIDVNLDSMSFFALHITKPIASRKLIFDHASTSADRLLVQIDFEEMIVITTENRSRILHYNADDCSVTIQMSLVNWDRSGLSSLVPPDRHLGQRCPVLGCSNESNSETSRKENHLLGCRDLPVEVNPLFKVFIKRRDFDTLLDVLEDRGVTLIKEVTSNDSGRFSPRCTALNEEISNDFTKTKAVVEPSNYIELSTKFGIQDPLKLLSIIAPQVSRKDTECSAIVELDKADLDDARLTRTSSDLSATGSKLCAISMQKCLESISNKQLSGSISNESGAVSGRNLRPKSLKEKASFYQSEAQKSIQMKPSYDCRAKDAIKQCNAKSDIKQVPSASIQFGSSDFNGIAVDANSECVSPQVSAKAAINKVTPILWNQPSAHLPARAQDDQHLNINGSNANFCSNQDILKTLSAVCFATGSVGANDDLSGSISLQPLARLMIQNPRGKDLEDVVTSMDEAIGKMVDAVNTLVTLADQISLLRNECLKKDSSDFLNWIDTVHCSVREGSQRWSYRRREVNKGIVDAFLEFLDTKE